VLKRFQPFLRLQMWPMILATLASLGFTVVTLLEPWPLQIVFDGVLLGRPVELLGIDVNALFEGRILAMLAAASVAVLLLAAARGQLYYAQNVLAALAGLDVVMAIRRQLFHHLQTLSMSFHRKAQSGDLLMRLTGDIVMLREMVVAALITLLTQGLVVVGILVIMATLNIKLTVVAALVVPLLFVILSVFRIRLVDAAQRQRKREGRIASRAHEVLTGIQLVQANTAEKYEDEQFKKMNTRSLRAGARVTRLEAQLNRAVQIAIAAGVCGILWLGAQDVLAERLTPGELLVFLAYLRGLYRPLRQVSKLTQRLAKASACGDRVLEVLDETPEVREPDDPAVLKSVQGRIRFHKVTFGYHKNQPVLHEVEFEASPGEMVALVGPTGAGKTTVLSLIARFADPQQGRITIDEVPVHRAGLKSLRRHISFLPQETVIMGATIRENIAYGAVGRKDSAPPEKKVVRAAKAARAHDFIMRLPKGYDTVVGERGATLSGGQRQRIAIARAVLRKAPILLLDEPTTGLDPLSGRAVLEALDTLTQDKTAIVVAHHLTTVLRADRIIFLEEGRVVEKGTHEELLQRQGRYAAFFEAEWGGLAGREDRSESAGPETGSRPAVELWKER
ncbi:MAG: ATP-binding cassette domain-containing protein, partial [Candidatus Eisenbacteria bacterium]|nr:ATP-binding cassette domain-containing protein [Candidatus Eisenbacteria bacterium]